MKTKSDVGYYRGHKMCFDEYSNEWYYNDTGELVKLDPNRPCGHCGLTNTPDGHDGCLETLSSVKNACCGHGIVDEAYIQFEDNSILRGDKAISYLEEIGIFHD